MISYKLRCEDGHDFDSWFQSAQAYEALSAAGHLSCAVCGSTAVEKSLMAPRLAKAEAQPRAAAPMALSAPGSDAEKALAELRRKVEENSDYVGNRFAAEARAMHLGDMPERSIYGEAGLEEARALAEDGVPVMPLPFKPRNKLS
jgi:hypothetical protein